MPPPYCSVFKIAHTELGLSLPSRTTFVNNLEDFSKHGIIWAAGSMKYCIFHSRNNTKPQISALIQSDFDFSSSCPSI